MRTCSVFKKIDSICTYIPLISCSSLITLPRVANFETQVYPNELCSMMLCLLRRSFRLYFYFICLLFHKFFSNFCLPWIYFMYKNAIKLRKEAFKCRPIFLPPTQTFILFIFVIRSFLQKYFFSCLCYSLNRKKKLQDLQSILPQHTNKIKYFWQQKLKMRKFSFQIRREQRFLCSLFLCWIVK